MDNEEKIKLKKKTKSIKKVNILFITVTWNRKVINTFIVSILSL